MVRKYVEAPKKPIEAIQITEANMDDALAFCPEIRSVTRIVNRDKPDYFKVYFVTPNGRAEAMDGDYILKNPDGTFDTMKQEAFEEAYRLIYTPIAQF